MQQSLSEKKREEIYKNMSEIIKKFLLGSEELDKNNKFFLTFSSKTITSLLTLIEDVDKKIRKVAFFVLSIFLQSDDAKVYLLEKCCLLCKEGTIALTRLKYLKDNANNSEKSLQVLIKQKLQPPSNLLFWAVDADSS